MMKWLWDLWRGWSDNDLKSSLVKQQQGSKLPGAITHMSAREMRALAHYYGNVWMVH